MKRNVLTGAVLLLAGSLFAAEPPAKQEILAAAKKLADQPNYTWKTTVDVPEGTRFRPGPTEGKTEKDGLTMVSMAFGETQTKAVLKGEKGAVTTQDGGWQSLSEIEEGENRGRFRAMMVRNIKTPAAQAAELADAVKDLKKDGEAYSGTLTEDGAKTLMSFRSRGGGDGPAISNAKGNVKFWLKDGVLSKYVYKVEGQMNFNNNDIDIDRTTTVEIKDIGTTKFEVPEEARKKLS